MAYSISLPYDQRLGPDDVAGSKAHVRGTRSGRCALGRRCADPLDRSRSGRRGARRWDPGLPPGDEDVHTAVERRVTELAGSVGARLHTGRSRNDQIATDLRLFTSVSSRVSLPRCSIYREFLLRGFRAAPG